MILLLIGLCLMLIPVVLKYFSEKATDYLKKEIAEDKILLQGVALGFILAAAVSYFF